MELKATNHSYYSSESNYYVNGLENWGRCDYDTWQDFKGEWLDSDGSLDDDLNHCFRFDIMQLEDEDEQLIEEYELWLFFILQRKGNYRPVHIKNIVESDMVEIESFLKARFAYLKNQWIEFA